MNPFCCKMVDVLAYTQWLIRLDLSASSIHNHLTALKTISLWLEVNGSLWELPTWKWNRRSVARVVRKQKKDLPVLQFLHFLKMMVMMGDHSWAPVRMAFILAFLGLLRVSNYTIKNKRTLDLSRNTLLRDITVDKDCLKIIVKWAKQLQDSSDFILLPKCKTKLLCPVENWLTYRNDYLPNDVPNDIPVISELIDNHLSFMTAGRMRFVLEKVLGWGKLSNYNYTLHSFRRGGGNVLCQKRCKYRRDQKVGTLA